jgi:mevalonate kinase
MKWSIPAKTFFLGEYAAIAERAAILITTSPYFEVTLTEQKGLDGIHPDSPGGLWWNKQRSNQGLSWHDPYQGCGGLGASSAQFVGSYLASCLLKNTAPSLENMLKAYYQCAWNGKGLRPSGYDLLAQIHSGCIYINRLKDQIHPYSWPFTDLSFFLIHTGTKLATHHHLQETTLPLQLEPLSIIVDKAKTAFEQGNSALLIQCINDYHAQLEQHHLVTPPSLELINEFRSYPEVLAIKGCGALGADILLILTRPQASTTLKNKLAQHNKTILASELNLAQTKKNCLIFK